MWQTGCKEWQTDANGSKQVATGSTCVTIDRKLVQSVCKGSASSSKGVATSSTFVKNFAQSCFRDSLILLDENMGHLTRGFVNALEARGHIFEYILRPYFKDYKAWNRGNSAHIGIL